VVRALVGFATFAALSVCASWFFWTANFRDGDIFLMMYEGDLFSVVKGSCFAVLALVSAGFVFAPQIHALRVANRMANVVILGLGIRLSPLFEKGGSETQGVLAIVGWAFAFSFIAIALAGLFLSRLGKERKSAKPA
jgi:hypothetical protein